jgi:hypothetical protein
MTPDANQLTTEGVITMKMSKALFAEFAVSLERQERLSPTAVQWLRDHQSPERYRWDRLWALPNHGEIMSRAYRDENLSDSHIDTALRKLT